MGLCVTNGMLSNPATHRPPSEALLPIIRNANPGDAAGLAQIAEQTFRETFAALNRAEDMDLHCRRSYGESLQTVEISDPGRNTLLVEHEDRLIGYAQLRWGAAPACVVAQRPCEIQRLYVVASWHGHGVAQELMAACIAEARRRRSDAIWLGVWERNPRALAFYRRCGFIEVGDHVFPLGNDPQRDLVMVCPLVT